MASTKPRLDLSGKVGIATDDINNVLDLTIGFDVHTEWEVGLRITRDEWVRLFAQFGLPPDKVPAPIKVDQAWASALRSGAAKVKKIETRRPLTFIDRDGDGSPLVTEQDVAYEVYFETAVRKDDGWFARLVRKRPYIAREKRARRQDYEITTITSVVWNPKAPDTWLPGTIDTDEFPETEYDYEGFLAAVEQEWILRRTFYDNSHISKAVVAILNEMGGYITKPSGGCWLIEYSQDNLRLLDGLEAFRDELIVGHHWSDASETPPCPEFAFLPIIGVDQGVKRVRKWVEDQVIKDLHAVIAQANALTDGETVPTIVQLTRLDEQRDGAMARLERYGDEVAASVPEGVARVDAEFQAARKRAAARRRPAKI